MLDRRISMDELEKLQKQHYDNYIKAIKEIVINNTNSLVDDDISSLIKKPPLDSMDQIKTKFLAIAKKEKVVLNTEMINKTLDLYRKNVFRSMQELKTIRNKYILEIIDKVSSEQKMDSIKISKKILNELNKEEKKFIKSTLDECINKYLITKTSKLFSKKSLTYDLVENELIKFFSPKGIYQKQLLDSIDFKLLVKDTTLINGIKEQSDRYQFTIKNSRLFN